MLRRIPERQMQNVTNQITLKTWFIEEFLYRVLYIISQVLWAKYLYKVRTKGIICDSFFSCSNGIEGTGITSC